MSGLRLLPHVISGCPGSPGRPGSRDFLDSRDPAGRLPVAGSRVGFAAAVPADRSWSFVDVVEGYWIRLPLRLLSNNELRVTQDLVCSTGNGVALWSYLHSVVGFTLLIEWDGAIAFTPNLPDWTSSMDPSHPEAPQLFFFPRRKAKFGLLNVP